MKILVADDSKTTRTLISKALKTLRHDIIEAENGHEAINLVETHRPDLIILDVVMEGIDGFECARRIRQFCKEDWIPIIFLSGTVDDENIANGINAGGDDYLTKPFSEIKLAAKIKAMQRISDMRKKLFETTEKLFMLSATDALTGINNRLQFDKTIKEKISYSNRYNKLLALLFVDLDHFKTINDTLGHPIGDQLLQEVANRLTTHLRLEDFIARLGGDEFAIILTDVANSSIPGDIADKIIRAINKPYLIEGNELNISCSIGIAIYNVEDGITEESLIDNADIAMYHAKALGRNNYQYFNDDINKKHHDHLNLETALESAIDNNQLYLEYQPIIDLRTRKIIRMEAFTYWQHPELGRISANQFLPIAEEIGMIDTISLWILHAACKQSSKWFWEGHRFILTINISPRQLLQKNLCNLIQNILDDTRMPSNYLQLELTETSPLIYANLYVDAFDKLVQLGIKIALDDFGTSYSSLSHLRTLPISAIKIDRSFILNIENNQKDLMLVKSIIELGRNMGFTVIAEGVETKEQLKILIKQGCKEGQGYYFCKPLNADEISKLIREHQLIIQEPI